MMQIKFEKLERLSTFLNSLTQLPENLKDFISSFEKFTILPIEGINPIYYDNSDLFQKILKISFVFSKRIFLDDNIYIEKNSVFPNLIFVEKNLREWLEEQMKLKFKIDSFLVECENTFELFLFCLKLMDSKVRNFDKSKIYIHKSAVIHENVVIGNNVYVGENSVIYPNCVIYDNVYIGSNVILHSNSVIGSDGFGYTTENEKIIKIPQEGGVVIKDGVEIGSCTCIDRATIGYTYIGENTKIDNLVQIGHNAKIGKNCRIAGKSGIAGSARIYENSIIAAMSGVRDGIKIGPNSILAGASSATKNIPPNQIYAGNPARPFHQHFRELAQQTKRS